MKKSIITFTMILLSLSSNTLAKNNSIEISGTFVNESGCRAYLVECSEFEDEGEYFNSCRFELYKHGEYFGALQKGGKITEVTENRVIAKDKGLRSSMVGIPTFKNTTAIFSITETYRDYSTFPEVSISKFDLKMKVGVLGSKQIECRDMVRE